MKPLKSKKLYLGKYCFILSSYEDRHQDEKYAHIVLTIKNFEKSGKLFKYKISHERFVKTNKSLFDLTIDLAQGNHSSLYTFLPIRGYSQGLIETKFYKRNTSYCYYDFSNIDLGILASKGSLMTDSMTVFSATKIKKYKERLAMPEQRLVVINGKDFCAI